MTPDYETEVKMNLGPRLMLALVDKDMAQWDEVLRAYRPIDVITSLAATCHAVALDSYGTRDEIRRAFRHLALAAEIDDVLTNADPTRHEEGDER